MSEFERINITPIAGEEVEKFVDSETTYSRPPLVLELKTFDALLPQLLESDLGRWALIKEAELRGVYDTENDAIKVGYQTYGNQPFLTRQILEHQPILFYGLSQAA